MSVNPNPATANDLITTIPGKRKHAFYVTPEGAAQATTPRIAPLVESPHSRDEIEGVRRRVVRLGLVLLVAGIMVTIGTYAILSATGDSGFLLASGPIIAGVTFMLRGSR